MHEPVLLAETVELLEVRPGGRYIDATVGGGGHAAAILQRLGPDGVLLGLDADAEAVERCRALLAPWGRQVRIEQGNFGDLAELAARFHMGEADGVVMDLGVSSFQLESPARGFSFQTDGPLDMRMDLRLSRTAANLLAELEERELRDLLRRLGEERDASRIARAVVRRRDSRPLLTTAELADVVASVKGKGRGSIHPATQTFMALRMAVNQELENLSRGLEASLDLIRPGGRVAVISFHSLEDRVVKQAFAAHAGRDESLEQGGSRWVGRLPRVAKVTRKALRPSAEETRRNPRARSAKLRVVEKVVNHGAA